MAEAKNELGRKGLWFGANMPTGYIPDRREEIDGEVNPDYRKIFPYWRHGEKIDWLYDKFMEQAGNVSGLRREIAMLPYLFPPFEDHIVKEIVNRCPLTKVLDENGKLLLCPVAQRNQPGDHRVVRAVARGSRAVDNPHRLGSEGRHHRAGRIRFLGWKDVVAFVFNADRRSPGIPASPGHQWSIRRART